jgi:hypothetical protein
VKTQPDEQQEPSMEEILSSIRRIISDDSGDDDDVEDAPDRAGFDAKASTASEAAPNAVLQPERRQVGTAEGGASEDGDDQDVLELTEVVGEGSTVLGVDAATSQPAPFKPKAFEPKPFEHDPAVKPLWSAGPAGRRSARGDSKDSWRPGGNAADTRETGFKPGSNDQATEASQDDRAATATGRSESSPGPAPAANSGTTDQQGEASSKQAADDKPARSWSAKPSRDDQPQSPTVEARKHDMANHETAVETSGNGRDTLMPKPAQDAPTGAFGKLPQTAQPAARDTAAGDRSGRTIEQLAEDMMRPMLSEWLDQNLPPLVEEIVQREVKKMFRRAQD